MPGRVVLVATPIGNLDDLSPRAAHALSQADLVAAEDTRHSRTLLDRVGAHPPMLSYHDHNEDRRTPQLLERVRAGQTVVLITDAGSPGVADPGYRLLRAAVTEGLPVEAVPGPSALLLALLLSGLPMERFSFEGFLPRKPGARGRRLARIAEDDRTLVFYAAPHRLAEELRAMLEHLGNRSAAVARELTKLHEEVWRGPLSELAERAAQGLRGEVTVVVAGAALDEREAPAPGELAVHVRRLIGAGSTTKEAIALVATETGVPKRVVYEAVVAGRRRTP